MVTVVRQREISPCKHHMYDMYIGTYNYAVKLLILYTYVVDNSRALVSWAFIITYTLQRLLFKIQHPHKRSLPTWSTCTRGGSTWLTFVHQGHFTSSAFAHRADRSNWSDHACCPASPERFSSKLTKQCVLRLRKFKPRENVVLSGSNRQRETW